MDLVATAVAGTARTHKLGLDEFTDEFTPRVDNILRLKMKTTGRTINLTLPD